MYTNYGKEIKYPAHVYIPLDSGVSEKFCTAIFHVNNCDEKTVLSDEEIESKQN